MRRWRAQACVTDGVQETYDPFGKEGAGAPVRDASGAPVGDFLAIRRHYGTSIGEDGVVSAPGRHSARPPPLSTASPSMDALPSGPFSSPARPTYARGVPAEDSPTRHTRFRFESLDAHQQQEARKKAAAKAEMQAALAAQIEEKRAARERKAAAERERERREAERLQRERDDIARRNIRTADRHRATAAAAAAPPPPPAPAVHHAAPSRTPPRRRSVVRAAPAPRGRPFSPVRTSAVEEGRRSVYSSSSSVREAAIAPAPAYDPSALRADFERQLDVITRAMPSATAAAGSSIALGPSPVRSRVRRELMEEQAAFRSQLARQGQLVEKLKHELSAVRREREQLVRMRRDMRFLPSSAAPAFARAGLERPLPLLLADSTAAAALDAPAAADKGERSLKSKSRMLFPEDDWRRAFSPTPVDPAVSDIFAKAEPTDEELLRAATEPPSEPPAALLPAESAVLPLPSAAALRSSPLPPSPVPPLSVPSLEGTDELDALLKDFVRRH
eukprot:PLAT5088.2.p1 GENE.PLAT5088.2~~PLAT5088.2.p1  ORF type:complete len:503 (+),score=137.71 PLAT5088.2:238-1746(+)